MERTDKHYASEAKFFCREIKNILTEDSSKISQLNTAVSNLVYNESGLGGQTYDKLRGHLENYVEIMNTLIETLGLISDKMDNMSVMMSDQDLDGEKIFSELERLSRVLTTLYEDSRQWEHEKQMYPGDFAYQNNPYSYSIEQNKLMKQMWEGQIAIYDWIEGNTSSQFALEEATLETIACAIQTTSDAVRDGFDVVGDVENVYVKRLVGIRQSIIDARAKIKQITKYDLIADIDSQEVIDAFWLTDEIFQDPYWIYNEDAVKTAAAYLRAEMRINGGRYGLIHDGYMTPEELIIYQRQMVLINTLLNTDKNPYFFDGTLNNMETICVWGDSDYYEIGWVDGEGHTISEEMLDIMIEYYDNIIGKEFGEWYEKYGHFFFDAAFAVANGLAGAPDPSLDANLAPGYSGWANALQNSGDSSDFVPETIIDFYNDFYENEWAQRYIND